MSVENEGAMPAAPIPLDEDERLRVLKAYSVLDGAEEPCYQDLVSIASHICGTPVALVTLVDENRQWFLARQGMEEQETDRSSAFCAYTILEPEVLVVPDARLDARFIDNPLVTGDPKIRFYAGAPLIAPGGQKMGSLCVIDQKPRQLDAAQLQALKALARQVVSQLELRRVASELAAALKRARILGRYIPICSYCRKIRDDNDFWSELELFVMEAAGSEISHGICPACADSNFPGLFD